jgi:hypothetical protein
MTTKDSLCPRCGATEQATHHPLCQHRDGTPTALSDDAVREALVEFAIARIAVHYEEGHAAVKAMRLSDGGLWAIACNRSEDFFLRQGAYIELNERGYVMPRMLPMQGDPMPKRRVVLTLVGGTRQPATKQPTPEKTA